MGSSRGRGAGGSETGNSKVEAGNPPQWLLSKHRHPLHSSRPRICSPPPFFRAHGLALTQASTGLPVVCMESTQPALPGPPEGECGPRVTGHRGLLCNWLILQCGKLRLREEENSPHLLVLPIPQTDKRDLAKEIRVSKSSRQAGTRTNSTLTQNRKCSSLVMGNPSSGFRISCALFFPHERTLAKLASQEMECTLRF